jgi:hypothetical protein
VKEGKKKEGKKRRRERFFHFFVFFFGFFSFSFSLVKTTDFFCLQFLHFFLSSVGGSLRG